jgi:hypothetical protein
MRDGRTRAVNQRAGVTDPSVNRLRKKAARHFAIPSILFVIPSKARNLSFFS